MLSGFFISRDFGGLKAKAKLCDDIAVFGWEKKRIVEGKIFMTASEMNSAFTEKNQIFLLRHEAHDKK